MKIEILYEDITNVYGDLGNIRYLKNTFKENEIIYTSINDEPYFYKHKVDMIYLGSFPDEYTNLVVNKLLPYIDKLKELIENNTLILFTGSALEIVGDYIEESNNKYKTLSLFEGIYFKRDKNKRHNSLFIGKFNDIKIVGFKHQFSMMYGDNKYPFITAKDGCIGMNYKSNKEGLHYKNFYGTYILGPILVLNPLFTKYLFKLINYNKKLYLEEELIKSYNIRLEDYDREDKRYLLSTHG